MHRDRHHRLLHRALRCILLVEVAVEHVGHCHRRLLGVGLFLERIAEERSSCACSGCSLCCCVRVHVVEHDILGVVVVEQQLMLARSETYYVALSWHVDHVARSESREVVHSETCGYERSEVVVLHTIGVDPCREVLPVGASVAAYLPLLLICCLYTELVLRRMRVVVETQILVLAR